MNRTVNNKVQTSPAIMNDGRSFTDYRPACYVDNMIANANQVKGSNEYREFLIKNGLNIMKVSDMYLEDKLSHKVCNNSGKKCVGTTCLDVTPSQNMIKNNSEITGLDTFDIGNKFSSL